MGKFLLERDWISQFALLELRDIKFYYIAGDFVIIVSIAHRHRKPFYTA